MTENEPFTKQERIAYAVMGCSVILGVSAMVLGLDVIPILTALVGLFGGISLPSPFDRTGR